MNNMQSYMIYGLSALICFGAIGRVVFGEGDLLNRIDNTTLLYLVVSGGLLFIRDAKKFTFGDYSIEFDKVKDMAEQAMQTAAIAEDTVRVAANTTRFVGTPMESLGNDIVPGEYHDDPWKGQFGMTDTANNRRLTGTVTPIRGTEDWFAVDLSVESLLPKRFPLNGEVKFFLHPTFPNDKVIVSVDGDGKARLKLKAWGAFTVGALADGGSTKLELDLAALESAPRIFKER